MRVALVFLTLLGGSAQASPLELYGVGLRGPARGVANIAGARDLFATFYNPAGLMDISRIEFAVTHQINAPGVDVALDRPGAPLAPALPETFQNTTAGFAVPLSGRLAGRASLGALLEVPNGLLVRARSLDTRRPHWYMYDSYPDIFIAQMALAVRFFDGFDLALGVHNNSGFQGAITAQIDLTTNTWNEREIDFKFTGQYGPMVGLRLAHEQLHFGLVYRSPLVMRFATPAGLTTAELDAGMHLDLSGSTHVLPTVVGAGLEWRSSRWSVELAAQWKQWSVVEDPSVDLAIDIRGQDAESLGLGNALDVPDPNAQPRQSPGFRDTLSVGLGGSAWLSTAWEASAGYSFVPSPIPDQVHHTNLIDHDRHVFGLSVVTRRLEPFGVFTQPLTVGPSIQWSHLASRRAEKAAGLSDPVGSWTATGHVISVTLGVQGAL